MRDPRPMRQQRPLPHADAPRRQRLRPNERPASWRVARAGVSLVLAAVVAASGSPLSAIATTRAPVPALLGDTNLEADLAGAPGADEAATDVLPSIHWQDALAHEADVIDFEPGERVTQGFQPRAGDRWEIDGRPARALPSGNATGHQLRAAREDGVWANGRPSDLAVDRRAGAHADALLDQPIDAAPSVAAAPAAAIVPSSGGDSVKTAPVGANGLRREIFGFLPYWELSDTSTTLDWRTLSTVAYFSVGCEANGSLDKTDPDGSVTTGWAGWTSKKMTSVINAAHQNQTRVVLTISCFAWNSSGASRQAALLGSATARANLARAAAAAVRDRGADGINLDFEPIAAGYADEFTALVRKVRSELNNVAPGYQLTFDTLGSIGNQPIANATAPGGADAVFIMGYDYRTDGASYAGSISPLTGPKYDLTDTVKAYLAKIPASKVILGIPYYGRAWSTASDRLNASTLSPSKYGYPASPTYGQAMGIVADYGRRWDSVEQAPWTAYRKQTCTSAYGCVTAWRELYYEDAASLRLRYDLVNRQDLRGAGIWALGYDDARTELRNALADKFLSDRTAPVAGVVTLAQNQRDEGFKVWWASWDDSAIAGYDVDVSVNGGAWTRWLTGTKATSSVYLGTTGRTYAFRVRAADVHGNLAAWNSSSQVSALGVPGSIAVGGFLTVRTDGLRMRTAASTGASIMTTLADGATLRVIGGPVSGEGYTWWQVAGPVKQWGPVDALQVGGWVAASGNGVTNAGPRRPVYATHVGAGITGLRLNDGGDRALTPNGDGRQDKLKVAWTNHGAFDSLALRIHRADGSLAGSVPLGATGDGAHAYSWDGRIGGTLVAPGTYVAQVQGLRGSTTFNAPSANPVTATQLARFGFIVGPASPTSVVSIRHSSAAFTTVSTIRFDIRFGGSVAGLGVGDVVRTGTASCSMGAPTGSGSAWSVTLTGCGTGTVGVAVKAETVRDAVMNWGPAGVVGSALVRIDRSVPSAAKPKVGFRSGVGLASASASSGLPAVVTWSATDTGGSGIRDYDVRRSVNGGDFKEYAVHATGTSLNWTMTPGDSYRFAVRARDRAGNVGGWVVGPSITPSLLQGSSRALEYRGGWSTATRDHYSGGSVRYATAAGASVRYAFAGRGVAFVTTTGPDRGAVRVYIDGTHVTTIDTWAAEFGIRRIAFSRTWAASGWHTIRLVVVGTAGHPRVDVDALEILR